MSIHQSFFIDKTITYLSAGTILQDAAATTSHVLSAASGIQVGDLLVAILVTGQSSGTVTTADFATQISNSAAGISLFVGSRIATASEAASYTITTQSKIGRAHV